MTAGAVQDRTINGMEAATVAFQATTSSGTLAGEATFILHDGRTFAFMAVATSSGWSSVAPTMRSAVDSFDRETDPEVLGVAPLRVRIRTLTDPTPWSVFTRQNPSEIPDAVLAVINHVAEGSALQAGPVKQVVRAR
jgi:predicted Zn-dependent protease